LIDVFIAHAPGDAAWSRDLAVRLTDHGLRVFLHEWSMLLGDVVVHRLDDAIRAATAGIVVVSPDAAAAPRAQEEYAALVLASAERGLRLIPVLLGGAVPAPLAANRVSRDFQGVVGAAYDAKVRELAAAIKQSARDADGPPPAGTNEENVRVTQRGGSRPVVPPDRPAFVVCYAGADAGYGGALAAQLRDAGLPVWSVGDLRPGDSHFWLIRQQLRYSLAVVVVMSAPSQDSEDITRMILEGQLHGRPFVPVLLDGERNYHLANTWYVDARDGRLLDPGELALLAKLSAPAPAGGGRPADPVTVLPPAAASPPVRTVRLPPAAGLRRLTTYLAEREYAHADLLTTALLLEAADRAAEGWLRARDGRRLPAGLLAGLDAVWAAHSHGRQGLRAQRGLARAGRGRPAEFLPLSVAYGWRASVDDTVPQDYREFAGRAGPGGRAGFFPTLRHPQNEHFNDWYDQWTATVLAVHLRLEERETLQ